MIDIINQVNDLLWGYVIIAVLVGCGVWFTVRMRFVQFRMLGEMVRLLNDSPVKVKGQERHISSFQAFTVSLASRIGTGNRCRILDVGHGVVWCCHSLRGIYAGSVV